GAHRLIGTHRINKSRVARTDDGLRLERARADFVGGDQPRACSQHLVDRFASALLRYGPDGVHHQVNRKIQLPQSKHGVTHAVLSSHSECYKMAGTQCRDNGPEVWIASYGVARLFQFELP